MFDVIEATHSDGDGQVLIRVNACVEEQTKTFRLSRLGALHLLAELAMAVNDEYGLFRAYDRPVDVIADRLSLDPH